MMFPVYTMRNPQRHFSFSKADTYIERERESRDREMADNIEKAIQQAMKDSESEVVMIYNQSVPTAVYNCREALRLIVESLYESGFKVSLKEEGTFRDAQGNLQMADFVLTIGWDWENQEEKRDS